MADDVKNSTPLHTKRPPRIVRIALVALAVLAAALTVAAITAGPAQNVHDGHWLRTALTSRMFLASAAVFLGSFAIVIFLTYALWQAGRGRRSNKAASSEDGAAIVEFALVLPIVLLFVLLMAQSALLMAGNLCVHYSAFCAARSAIVTVPLDLNVEEPQNYVTDPSASAKMNRIKAATVWALLPISCGSDRYGSANVSDLQRGLGLFFSACGQATPAWVINQLPRRFQYAMDNSVTTLQPPAAHALVYAEHEDLIVNVEHTFYLSVPYINRMFQAFAGDDGRVLSFGQGEYGLIIRASCRLPNEGVRDYVDVERF